MEKYCDDCDKVIKLTDEGYCGKCGKHADNMPTNEELIKQRDKACEDIINAEILKKIKGLPNDLV
jgi:predicted amidophosphoribosyltransferase